MANQFLIKSTMAAMRAMSTSEKNDLQIGVYEGVLLLGYYEKGDTPAPIIYYLTDTTADDDCGSIIHSNGVKLVHNFTGDVGVKYFGARDGFSSDQGVQYAIYYAIKNQLNLDLNGGRYLIDTKLIIIRIIDTEPYKEKFIIKNGKLITTTDVPLLWGETYDVKASQLVEFHNVKFGSTSTNGYVLKNNTIIRTSFVGCDFVGIKFVNSIRHLQSLYFINCNIREWKGRWFEASDGLYDIKFNTCLIETGDEFLYIKKGFVNGLANLYISGCCIEGMNGAAIQFTGAAGITITGCYFEHNKYGDIISLGSVANDNIDYGLNIENNFMYTSGSVAEENVLGYGYWHIVLFKVQGANIKGNNCTGNLAYVKSSVSDIDFHNAVFGGVESNLSNKRGITKSYFGPDTSPSSVNYDLVIEKGSIIYNNNYSDGQPVYWICLSRGNHSTAIWKPIYTSTISHKGTVLLGNEDLNSTLFRVSNAIYFPVAQANWLTTGLNFPTIARGALEVLYSNNGNTLDCIQRYTTIHDGDSITNIYTRRYQGTTGGWTVWVRNDNVIATPAGYGVVKQSAAVPNAVSAEATDLNTAIKLVNELKNKFNSKLIADRNSGQQG